MSAPRSSDAPDDLPPQAADGWRLVAGGVVGNARLTAMTGMLLLVLLFVEGMTLLRIRLLFPVHAFVGFLLIPPILLKLASTGYRFTRYYTGNARYRAAGPPRPIPRIIAPVLVASTIVLMASGIVLLLVGPGDGGRSWRTLHILSFLLWFGAMAVHVLTYLARAPMLAWPDLVRDRGRPLAGALTRQSLVVASVVLGLAVALVALPWDASWLHRLGGG